MKLTLATCCLAIVAMIPASAQAPANQTPQQGQAQGQAQQGQAGQSAEITGCLSKSGNDYMLSSTGGEKMQVMGDAAANLDAHANQEVKVTGTRMMKDGKTTLNVTKVEMVKATCTTKS